MYCAPPPPTHPLFSREPRVVQPTLAYEVDRSIRQIGPHIGGDRLNECPQFPLAEADLRFCPFCISNIDDRPNELEIIGSCSQRPRQYSNVLDATVGKEQSILAINGATAGRSSF